MKTKCLLPRLASHTTTVLFIVMVVTFLARSRAEADVIPHLINHQGRVVVNNANFTGNGLFTFSLVNTGGTHWTSGQLTLPVSNGLYSVNLGESSMIPTSVFSNADLKLRIVFNDQVNGPQTLTPDQPVTTAPYAFVAEQLCLPLEADVTEADTLIDFINNGTGGLAIFESTNATRTEPALSVETVGPGRNVNSVCSGTGGSAGFFGISNAANPDFALEAQSSGSGLAFRAFSDGTGRCAEVQIDSTSNSQIALDVLTKGTGTALSVETTGSGTALVVDAGTGQAAVIRINSASNSQNALTVSTGGNGNALNVNANGSGTALLVEAASGLAGHFVGGVQVNGQLDVASIVTSGNVAVGGNLSKASGTFKIDHPLDPANKYLYHSFVESPDMMNIYNGNVVTDGNGDATVELPEYFEALNRDFRYQLTILGDTFAMARVSEKIRNRQFSIVTSEPGVEVSWQVTGIRQDAWANDHRIQVEEEKPEDKKGTYYGMKAASQ